MTLPRCPHCAAPVESDWDWCQQCGYDPEGLRPERVEVGALAGRSAAPDKETRSRRARHRKKASVVAAAPPRPTDPIDLRPAPPRRPTDTVYGLLPYDDPSSVSPLEPDPPDNSERINRRFAVVALCVIIVGLAVLMTALLLG